MTAHRVPAPKPRLLRLRFYTGQRNFEYKASLSQLHRVLEDVVDSYELEVLDGEEYRELAIKDGAPFTPLLVRVSPLPVVRIAMPQPTKEVLKEAILS